MSTTQIEPTQRDGERADAVRGPVVARPQRLTFRQVGRDIVEHVVDLDRGIWRTLIDLVVRPRAVYRTFLFEDRRRYTNPVKLSLATGTIVIVLLTTVASHVPDTLLAAQLNDIRAGGIHDEAFLARISAFIHLVFTTLHFQMIALSPLIAVLMHLLHRRSGYFVAEGTAFWLYTISMYNVLTMAALPAIRGPWLRELWVGLFFLEVAYGTYAGVQFYGGRWWWTGLKLSIGQLAFWLIYSLLSSMAAGYLIARAPAWWDRVAAWVS